MSLWQGVVSQSDVGTEEGGWFEGGSGAGWDVQFGSELDQGVVVDVVTDLDNSDVGRDQVLLDESLQVFGFQGFQGVGLTKSWQSQGGALEGGTDHVFQNHVLWRVFEGLGDGDSLFLLGRDGNGVVQGGFQVGDNGLDGSEGSGRVALLVGGRDQARHFLGVGGVKVDTLGLGGVLGGG